jgi:SpoU rRNA methylase family enzyme
MKFNVRKEGKLHERQVKSCKLQVVSYWFKRQAIVLLVPCSLFLAAFSTHPFYMSVTEIEYRPQQKELQIACKIFIDDLEDALKAETKKAITLSDEKQKADHQALIYKYLQQHFKLTVDGKPVTYEMLGFEKEQEAVWNYLVVKNVSPFKTATVYNDVLYQLRDGQINIIHFKANNHTQSYRLNAPTTQHHFQW